MVLFFKKKTKLSYKIYFLIEIVHKKLVKKIAFFGA